ncbi:calcium channel subunit Mid1 [Dothidotthia symphoricarpi CBS 119687]|uniref:Calcium channel subunit Mid1 n=1 Tax=Dothidotthia symphoricarpi CBS 119687 TaxID=1392245 RepID=A0A6A6AB64_9PLEO|nr:calcium channel subunit Mid1 [Dothidotthia symphoricarpi CBS 119687]KAF2129009.1 calcium channel subunit Mid1 [Dothidotthia symphoricarpi CBS 119687]
MQPPKPTWLLRSRLLVYAIVSCLLIALSTPFQLVQFACAAEILASPGPGDASQLVLPAPLDEELVLAENGQAEREDAGGYMPDFAYFARSLLGRQAPDVRKLVNNNKTELDIGPDATTYFVLEAPKGNNSVWISANTCQQPVPQGNQTGPASPQLTMYVSTSTRNQKPGPNSTDHLATNNTGVVFDGGFASFKANATSNVYIGISAPKLSDDWFGSWHFEVAAGTDGLYHSYNDSNPFLFMVDTDSESALFITYNLTASNINASNETENVDRWKNNNPFTMYAFPASDRTPVTGLEHSYCAVKRQFTNTTISNLTTDTTITTRFGAGYPKGQFHVQGLDAAKTYNGFLVVQGNEETWQLPGVGTVRAGGKVFQQFNWTTKADDSCQVLFDLEFCDSVAYAVPSSPDFKLNDAKLKDLYEKQAREYYQNFENSLDQVACDAPSESQYSLARTCDHCRTDYKRWLCSVLIPRCEDWTAEDSWLHERNINAPFPNGTVPYGGNLSKEFNETKRDRFAYSQSRNSMIDQKISPGPYKEMLPCEDLCFDIVRSCPSQLGFACPNPPARELSYGRRDPTGDRLTCSFPGAVVKLNVQGAASALNTRMGSVVLIASLVVTLLWI